MISSRTWTLVLLFSSLIAYACAARILYVNTVYHKPKVRNSSLVLNDQPALLLVFNNGHDREAENLLASIKKNAPELLPLVTVCVSDDKSRDFARRHKLQYFEMSTIKSSGTHLTKNMNVMTRRKLEAILYLLENNKTVLYTDTDVVFMTNPIQALNSTYDLNIQNDLCSGPYDAYHLLCTGFMYVKPGANTVHMFEQAISEIIKREYFIFDDQDAINLLVKQQDRDPNVDPKHFVSVKRLDPCKFPNGCRYFEGTDLKCTRKDALIVHNNYISGIDKKMQRFAENNLIFTTELGT